jgi:hypothetical protein
MTADFVTGKMNLTDQFGMTVRHVAENEECRARVVTLEDFQNALDFDCDAVFVQVPVRRIFVQTVIPVLQVYGHHIHEVVPLAAVVCHLVDALRAEMKENDPKE